MEKQRPLCLCLVTKRGARRESERKGTSSSCRCVAQYGGSLDTACCYLRRSHIGGVQKLEPSKLWPEAGVGVEMNIKSEETPNAQWPSHIGA